jgi:hypothetical protein
MRNFFKLFRHKPRIVPFYRPPETEKETIAGAAAEKIVPYQEATGRHEQKRH